MGIAVRVCSYTSSEPNASCVLRRQVWPLYLVGYENWDVCVHGMVASKRANPDSFPDEQGASILTSSICRAVLSRRVVFSTYKYRLLIVRIEPIISWPHITSSCEELLCSTRLPPCGWKGGCVVVEVAGVIY